MNKSKNVGTSAETAVVRYLRKHGASEEDALHIAARVVRNDAGCLIWQLKSRTGRKRCYGLLHYKGLAQAAHRYVYRLTVGEVPDGLVLDHLCRVTLCVNPVHLEPVTQAVNLQRAAALITHCPQGHEYTPENMSSGRRNCKACGRERAMRNYYADLERSQERNRQNQANLRARRHAA